MIKNNNPHQKIVHHGSEPQRLNQFLAKQKICSRREADQMIDKGWIYIDDIKVKKQGVQVQPKSFVTLSPKAIEWLESKQTVVLNKPPGFLSHADGDRYKLAAELITTKNYFGKESHPRVSKGSWAPAGRLDIDSTGLLILTQEGPLARALIQDNSPIDKEYIVKVNGQITSQKLSRLCHGLQLDGKTLRPAQVTQINETQLRFILREGRKRQIRRMCDLVNLNVETLKRIRIGPIQLQNLPRGKWRPLDASERIKIKQHS